MYVPLPGYIHREICSEFSLEFQSLSSSTESMFIDLILDLVGEREGWKEGGRGEKLEMVCERRLKERGRVVVRNLNELVSD